MSFFFVWTRNLLILFSRYKIMSSEPRKRRLSLKKGSLIRSTHPVYNGLFEWWGKATSKGMGILRNPANDSKFEIPLREMIFPDGYGFDQQQQQQRGGEALSAKGGKKRKRPQDFREGERVFSISQNRDLAGDFEWVGHKGSMGRVRRGGSSLLFDIPLKDLVYPYRTSLYRISQDQDQQDQDMQQQQEGGGGGGGGGGVPLRDHRYIQRKQNQNRILLQDIKKLNKQMREIRLLALDDFDDVQKRPRTMAAFEAQGGLPAHYYSPNLGERVVQSVKSRGGHSQKMSVGQYMSRRPALTEAEDRWSAVYLDYCGGYRGTKFAREGPRSPQEDIVTLFKNSDTLLDDEVVLHLTLLRGRTCVLNEEERYAIIMNIFSLCHSLYRGKIVEFRQWDTDKTWKVVFIMKRIH